MRGLHVADVLVKEGQLFYFLGRLQNVGAWVMEDALFRFSFYF